MQAFSAILALALSAQCLAFAPSSLSSRTLAPARSSSSLRMVEKVDVDVVSPGPKRATLEREANELKSQANDLKNKAQESANNLKNVFKDIDAGTLSEDFEAALEGAKKNIKQGKVGERNELVTLLPYVLFVFLLGGDVPFLGGPLEFVAGPGLLIGGAASVIASILTLGKNLSPWPQPCDGNVLKTSGVYSLCRHPTYAGLVAFGFGLGFATDSFQRIALAAALLYVFDQKASKEEDLLEQVHPAYKTYQEEVPKFFPLPSGLKLPKL